MFYTKKKHMDETKNVPFACGGFSNWTCSWQKQVSCMNIEPAPFGYNRWNFGEKKIGKIFWNKKFFWVVFLFTLYTKPKLDQIRPRIIFSQAKWLLYHSASGEILEKNKKFGKIVRNNFFFESFFYSPFTLYPFYPKLGPKSNFLGQNDYSIL